MYLCPEEKIKKTKRTERPFSLLTIDESMASIERLKEKYKPVHKQVRKGEDKTSKPSAEDTMRLRQQWYNEFVDILEGTKEELPPLREVNHEINLIDPNKKHTYRLPQCHEGRVPHQVHKRWMVGTSNNFTSSTTNVCAQERQQITNRN